MQLILLVFVLILATFLGRELISKVPSQLHTPLMSATNAISGITVLGALVVCATNVEETLPFILSLIAIVLATINTVGGYMVTNRMLLMFKQKSSSDVIKKEDKN